MNAQATFGLLDSGEHPKNLESVKLDEPDKRFNCPVVRFIEGT